MNECECVRMHVYRMCLGARIRVSMSMQMLMQALVPLKLRLCDSVCKAKTLKSICM